MVSKDGLKFWSSQMWQHFLTQTKHFDRECTPSWCCDICGKDFANKRGLRRHIGNVHEITFLFLNSNLFVLGKINIVASFQKSATIWLLNVKNSAKLFSLFFQWRKTFFYIDIFWQNQFLKVFRFLFSTFACHYISSQNRIIYF